MKIKHIERMFTVHEHHKRNGYVATLWDGRTQLSEVADSASCDKAARAVIHAAATCEFVGTLRTYVKALRCDGSGGQRVACVAYLRVTDACISPLSNVKAGCVFRLETFKSDRGHGGVVQPVQEAAAWVRHILDAHCRTSVSVGEVAFLVDPLRHTPSAMDATVEPREPELGSYVEQSYLVYTVTPRVERVLQKLDTPLSLTSVPRLTELYFSLHRRGVAYTKAVQALEEELLINPVVAANNARDMRLLSRDVSRISITI